MRHQNRVGSCAAVGALVLACADAAPEPVEEVQQVSAAIEREDGQLLAERRDRIRRFFQQRWERRNAVAVTITDHGQTIDWVPRAKGQASPPSDAPEHVRMLQDGETFATTELQAQPHARGPEGTVPVPRFDVERYLQIVAEQVPDDPEDVFDAVDPPDPTAKGYYYTFRNAINDGSTSFQALWAYVNAWDVPQVAGTDHSIVQLSVARGSASGRQTVESGKIETPTWNSGSPTFFVYYTTNGYSGNDNWEGGYNQDFQGWQQVSGTVFPKGIITNMSTLGGAQTVFDVAIRRLSDGNWWVWAFGEWVGYYPECIQDDCDAQPYLFDESGIRTEADELWVYGEVDDDYAPSATSTDMGSGEHGGAGLGYAAYLRTIRGIETGDGAYTAYQSLDADLNAAVTDVSCYSMTLLATGGTNINRFFYGGGGDEDSGCD